MLPLLSISLGDAVSGRRAVRCRTFPNQGKTVAGLPEFVKDGASLAKQDVVVWYTTGYTHVARPEDFPVMPAETIGFRLIPRGFFTRNPALGVADQSW